jgi:hypothetical protein
VIGVSLAGVTSRQIQLDAVASLPAHSFLIDGEAIVTDAKGLAVFNLICRQRHNSNICRGQGVGSGIISRGVDERGGRVGHLDRIALVGAVAAAVGVEVTEPFKLIELVVRNQNRPPKEAVLRRLRCPAVASRICSRRVEAS